jgi:hypothetical protein
VEGEKDMKKQLIDTITKIQNKILKDGTEATRKFNDPFDNCLICPHAIIKENELAKMAKAYGWMQLAKRFDFPVVICGKEPGGKYVANPTARPGWCTRK